MNVGGRKLQDMMAPLVTYIYTFKYTPYRPPSHKVMWLTLKKNHDTRREKT